MTLNRPELLAIYLNDHLAGSAAGVEMARRTRASNSDTEFDQPLARLCADIETDRKSLEAVMDELGIDRSRLKPALGWLAEKFGRVKPNGQLRGYSPLSRVVELESLLLGITGKLRLWSLLDELVGDQASADFAVLIARAEEQRATVEELQRRAARLL
jgi:hypothetical protein